MTMKIVGFLFLVACSYIHELYGAQKAYLEGRTSPFETNRLVTERKYQTISGILFVVLLLAGLGLLVVSAGWWTPLYFALSFWVSDFSQKRYGNPLLPSFWDEAAAMPNVYSDKMRPYGVAWLAALVGLFGWGLKGLVLGTVGGLLGAFLVGSLLALLGSGLLPRRIRKLTAARFVALHPDLTRRAFPSAQQTALLRSIEAGIERICWRAVTDNRSVSAADALGRDPLLAATTAVLAEEQNSDARAFLSALGEHLVQEWHGRQ